MNDNDVKRRIRDRGWANYVRDAPHPHMTRQEWEADLDLLSADYEGWRRKHGIGADGGSWTT